MTPEIQAALNQFWIILIGLAGTMLAALGVVVQEWLKERRRRRKAEGDLAIQVKLRQATTDVEREEIFNEFCGDCLKNLTQLRKDFNTLRENFDEQERTHEADRQRWIEERNAIREEMGSEVQRLRNELAEAKGQIEQERKVYAKMDHNIRRLQQDLARYKGAQHE